MSEGAILGTPVPGHVWAPSAADGADGGAGGGNAAGGRGGVARVRQPWEQVVVDKQGRRRFHGAFTGGWSAGHYMTVGSEEGFKPRSADDARGHRQSVADYVDEEDDPLLGRSLATRQAYDTLGDAARDVAQRSWVSGGGGAGGAARGFAAELASRGVPQELIVPASDSVGRRLLQLMGWREGQGLGPRRARRRRAKAGGDDDDDPHAAHHLFAPKNTAVTATVAKNNVFGVGYQPHRDAPEFAAAAARTGSALAVVSDGRDGRRRRGLAMADALRRDAPRSGAAAAFGLSALDEAGDEDDAYGDGGAAARGFHTSLPMLGEEEEAPMLLEDQRKRQRRPVGSHRRLCRDGNPPLPGFVLASRSEAAGLGPAAEAPRPIEVPRDWVPIHTFAASDPAPRRLDGAPHRGAFDAQARAVMLGERRTGPPSSQRKSRWGAAPGAAAENAQPPPPPPGLPPGMAQQPSSTASDSAAPAVASASRSALKSRFAPATGVPLPGPTDASLSDAPRKPVRTEEDWAPHRLLCKRLGVHPPSNAYDGLAPKMGGRDRPMAFAASDASHALTAVPLGAPAPPMAAPPSATADSAAVATAGASSGSGPASTTDVLLAPQSARPGIDLFKAVFAPSSDESSSDESDTQQGGAGAADIDSDASTPKMGPQPAPPAPGNVGSLPPPVFMPPAKPPTSPIVGTGPGRRARGARSRGSSSSSDSDSGSSSDGGSGSSSGSEAGRRGRSNERKGHSSSRHKKHKHRSKHRSKHRHSHKKSKKAKKKSSSKHKKHRKSSKHKKKSG